MPFVFIAIFNGSKSKYFFFLAIVVFVSAIVPLWPYRCSVLFIDLMILCPPNWLYSSPQWVKM